MFAENVWENLFGFVDKRKGGITVRRKFQSQTEQDGYTITDKKTFLRPAGSF